MDILFKQDDFVFSYRVGGVLIRDGKKYMYAYNREEFDSEKADELKRRDGNHRRDAEAGIHGRTARFHRSRPPSGNR